MSETSSERRFEFNFFVSETSSERRFEFFFSLGPELERCISSPHLSLLIMHHSTTVGSGYYAARERDVAHVALRLIENLI